MDVKAEIEFLKLIQVIGGVDVKSMVAGLLCQIDEANRSMQLSFQGAYIGFTTNPCGSDEWFKKRVDEIIQKESLMREKLTKIRNELTGTPASDINKALAKASKELIPNGSESAQEEFEQASKDSEEWKKRP